MCQHSSGFAFHCGAIPQLVLTLPIAACVALPAPEAALPGGARFFSLGSAQDPVYFATEVARVQASFAADARVRIWQDHDDASLLPDIAPLQTRYRPISVRWKLKDGRCFLAADIDLEAMMRSYFATHDLPLQWQVEDRARAPGDYDPALVYEVRDDEVIVKWLLRYNHTPIAMRGREQPRIENLQFPVVEVKGVPTCDVDFEQLVERGA